MTGLLTISMEVELGWGNHDTGDFSRLSRDGRRERAYLRELLSECVTTDVPITFDVVGHLFLAECGGEHDGPHEAGWFDGDPGTDAGTDPLFYAPDVVDAILSSPVDHELCTHTFSHVLFEEVSREVAAWELERVQALHREHAGGPTTSLVAPRHHSPPADVLRDAGIRVVRPPLERSAATKGHRFVQLLAGPEPLSALRVADGLVETTCTTNPSLTAPSLALGQGPPHAAFRPLPESLRRQLHLRKLKRATRRATRTDGHLHLWSHLFDLANDPQWRTVRAYLRWLAGYRERNDLTVATMAELPEHAGVPLDRAIV